MKRLQACRLYGILDAGYVKPAAMGDVLAAMIDGGVDIVQLRAKGHSIEQITHWAEELQTICLSAGVPFVVNDFPELGYLADGIHIGQEDGEIEEVRKIAEGNFIGKSTHSLDQAEAAAAAGADYIGFGPLFPTPTKAGRPAIGLKDIAEVHRRVPIPIFCIGGIKLENLPRVIDAGARRVVIVSGILQAVDIWSYVSECRQLLDAAY